MHVILQRPGLLNRATARENPRRRSEANCDKEVQ
jgi:hypothetical protein